MITKIISVLRCQPKKVKRKVKLSRPFYADRHEGRDFLILATGPSLRRYKRKIQEFIDKMNPVVIAGNFIDDMFIPDYHAFVNRKRYSNYAKSINRVSRVLLSPYFPDNLVKAHYKGAYEEIAFENKYPSKEGKITISDGIIYAEGATLATILMGVAIVMGAKNIFVAGMDGYSKSDSTHHYHEPDNKTLDDLLIVEKSMKKQLACLAKFLKSNKPENGNLVIITPTVYEIYYKPIEYFIG